MEMMGAASRQPLAYPAGSSAGSHGLGPSSALIQSNGSACRTADAARPVARRTPVAGLATISSSLAMVRLPHLLTRSSIPTRCGPQIAPAAAEVVRCGRSAAATVTASPASARQIAVVRPEIPAPMTRTSGSPRVTLPPVLTRSRSSRAGGEELVGNAGDGLADGIADDGGGGLVVGGGVAVDDDQAGAGLDGDRAQRRGGLDRERASDGQEQVAVGGSGGGPAEHPGAQGLGEHHGGRTPEPVAGPAGRDVLAGPAP